MSTHDLVTALEANLAAELSGKAEQCALLQRQEAAITAGDPAALEGAAAELVGELEAGIERARARTQIMAELATALGVDASRVESIVAALGTDGRRLAAQRRDLRAICAESLACGRRLGVLVRAHGALVEEALGRFLAPDPSGAPLGRGSLVDARA
jgi:hypothetical protein